MVILEILVYRYPSSQRMTSVFGEHDVFLTKSAHCPEEPSKASDFVTDEDIGGLHILYPAPNFIAMTPRLYNILGAITISLYLAISKYLAISNNIFTFFGNIRQYIHESP